MKIAIIGAGNVGASAAALLIARKTASKIALVDIAKNPTLGKALDLNHMAAVFNSDTKVKASNEYKIIKNADICVITAGMPRKEGMSRNELLEINANIIKTASQNIAKYAPNSVIIVVSNPLDALTFCAYKASGFKSDRVFGMAGELDSARLKYEIANQKGAKNSQIKAEVYGEHGEHMLPCPALLKGKVLESSEQERFFAEAKNGGAKIINLLGTSAYFAPAAGIVKICEALRAKDGRVLICSAIHSDEIPCGTKVKFGKKIKILKAPLSLENAKKAIKAQCEKLKI